MKTTGEDFREIGEDGFDHQIRMQFGDAVDAMRGQHR
jgi:hypothetical protein